MRLVGLITWFIFIIPVGVNYSKVFWCLPWTGKMDVANDNTCWTSPASKVSNYLLTNGNRRIYRSAY